MTMGSGHSFRDLVVRELPSVAYQVEPEDLKAGPVLTTGQAQESDWMKVYWSVVEEWVWHPERQPG